MTACKVCTAEFAPRNSMRDKTCGDPICRAEWKRQVARQKVEKEGRRKARARLDALRPRSWWQAKAQAAVNAWVRMRDEGLPCISCGTMTPVQWHAGHYLSRGAHPELALEPRNIHRQCSQCNDYLSGNQVRFRQGLIERYGQELVDWLEGPHEPVKLTVQELIMVRDRYLAMVKGNA